MDPFQKIDQALADALHKLGPARRRKAMREIAQYLRRMNRFRIRAQRNVDGSAYAARRNKRHKGKMMRGFARRMEARWNLEQAVVSVGGRLAPIHHEGQMEKGIVYPSRELLGLNETDRQEVLDILLRNLELD